MIELLLEFDAVIVAGQAKSHCVAWTVEDLLDDAPEIASRLYLLEDCSSPVVVPGAVDYTDDAERRVRPLRGAGVHVVRSTEPLIPGPGPFAGVASESLSGRAGERLLKRRDSCSGLRTRARKTGSRRASASSARYTLLYEPLPVVRTMSTPARTLRTAACARRVTACTAAASVESVITTPR